MSEKSDNKKIILKKMLPGILCSAVIIGVLIYFVDWSVLRDALKNCSTGLFLTLFALQTVSFFCRGMAWRVILNDEPSWLNSFFTITEGYLLNLLPLRLGEIGRSVIMGGLIGRSPFYVFTTVILERIFDVLITLILLVITIPMLSSAAFSGTVYYILFAVILLGLLFMFWIAAHQQQFMDLLKKIIKPDTKAGQFILSKIGFLLSGMEIMTQPKRFVVWLFWILATWACWIATLRVGILGFFPQLPFWAGLFTQGIGALGGAIPSAPAGIGVVEGAYVVALGFFGIDQSSSLAFGLVMHAVAIVTPVVWGLIGFSVQGLKLGEVFANTMGRDLTSEDSGE
ncbi:MAG: flippase-like domain-containing protein [Anaerolineaceae bacterium]|nr:flippase-like domain-containing protein [Anaerolineaceae bacterium]